MKSVNILLVGPYKADELRIGQYLSPPLGIYRIASYLRKKGLAEVDVVDCNLDGKEAFMELLTRKEYDIIGFSLLYQTLKNDICLICAAKEKSKALLVAGGQGAAFCADILYSNSPVDVMVKGFGEFAMEQIIDALQSGTGRDSLRSIPGLLVRSEEGFADTGYSPPYTHGQFREISLSLDFSIIPYERYWSFMENVYTERHLKIMKNDGMLKTVRIMCSSHCPMGCKFCSATNFLGNAVGRQRPLLLDAIDILTLMKNITVAHPGVESIYFCDDDFLLDKSRVVELCRLMEESGEFSGKSFFCLSRVDRVDEDMLRLMKRVGFKFIIYGVESFSKRVLKDMSKVINDEEPSRVIKDMVEKTLAAGLTPLMNIILFYPTATVQDIIETIEKSADLVEKGARLCVYTYTEVYPGSTISQDSTFETTARCVDLDGEAVSLPDLILPRNPVVKVLAERSVDLSERITSALLSRHGWQGVVPHPLRGLSVFMAVYSLLGMDYSSIERIADNLVVEALDEKRLYVKEGA